ncbi:MAG: TetR family transcriptional regulator [Haliea sp.]|nr:TetR family transcriptional regulator [Haliea sp.]
MSKAPARARRVSYSSPRQRERQQRILAVVREQISAVGYEALNIRDLAAASGVALKTLYNLYGSKDELLLAAVADLLSDVQNLEPVAGAEPGIPRLLAHTQAIATQIVETPAYADTMARTLFQAGRDHHLIDVMLGSSVRLVTENLQYAATQGELIENLDLKESAQVLAGHQWSMVLLWSKGLIALDSIPSAMLRSSLLSLIPLCRGERRAQLEQQLGYLGSE